MTTILFMITATMVAPIASSTANNAIMHQNHVSAQDTLGIAHQHGALSHLVRNYNPQQQKFVQANGSNGEYVTTHPPGRFGTMLSNIFASQGVMFNVAVSYQTDSGKTRTRQIVYQGQPSSTASVASQTVFLYDNQPVGSSGKTLKQSSNFYIPDESNGPLYNVVRVKLTVWSM